MADGQWQTNRHPRRQSESPTTQSLRRGQFYSVPQMYASGAPKRSDGGLARSQPRRLEPFVFYQRIPPHASLSSVDVSDNLEAQSPQTFDLLQRDNMKTPMAAAVWV
jgi:hypothetical protein